MAGVYSQQGCELISSIELMTVQAVEQALSCLHLHVPLDARKEIANKAGKNIANELAASWGGQQVYIPMDLARRNATIYEAFTGDNIHDLARKYHTSTNNIYDIIKAERDRRRHRQLKLLS